jgi:hypothetical protein
MNDSRDRFVGPQDRELPANLQAQSARHHCAAATRTFPVGVAEKGSAIRMVPLRSGTSASAS